MIWLIIHLSFVILNAWQTVAKSKNSNWALASLILNSAAAGMRIHSLIGENSI